ncbi:MAG: hypothetical protein WC774_05630 [Candidatus Gracilibacteria bacterium]
MKTLLKNPEIGENNLIFENRARLLQEQSVSQIAEILSVPHQKISRVLKEMNRRSHFTDRQTDQGKRFVTFTSSGVDILLRQIESKPVKTKSRKI